MISLIAILIITIILTSLDQIFKIIIDNNILLGESIKIIPNFFDLTLAHNSGAAWSILKNESLFLVIIGFTALFIVYFCFIRNKKLKKVDIFLIGMLISGIVGNLIDRIRLGYVIDYLDFNIFGYDYPVFNLADIFIVISIIILVVKSLKEEKNAKVQNK